MFSRLGSLEVLLCKEIGIEESAVLAYLSDGRRLRTDNVRDLAGAQDQVRLLILLCFSHPYLCIIPHCAYGLRVRLLSFSHPTFSRCLLV
jgi:hypothetical protein